MSKPINVYSTPDLRQTLDEALPSAFERLGYAQSFKLIDTKLIIGYSIALVAGISFLLDKKLKFEESLLYQKILVALYALLSGMFWYFNKYVEKGVKYNGSSADKAISVVTKMEKYSYDYQVTINDSKGRSTTSKLLANTVFNEAGYLQSDKLFKWLEERLDALVKKAN
ncbi:LANO_0G12728g1_1 [Lachancea nothofagi CBS 11611]|uniref:Signal peptidase complex subunit 2 n=1 Tax=Lachancea nothofagi CBS 11611 TaxID=1266666 RepID=A0A1G4KJT2_9SACH|nr:LANO_0G12728g1_1 [Lachancea nothofagi CBS 11611]